MKFGFPIMFLLLSFCTKFHRIKYANLRDFARNFFGQLSGPVSTRFRTKPNRPGNSNFPGFLPNSQSMEMEQGQNRSIIAILSVCMSPMINATGWNTHTDIFFRLLGHQEFCHKNKWQTVRKNEFAGRKRNPAQAKWRIKLASES